jgi:hypothetical protein
MREALRFNKAEFRLQENSQFVWMSPRRFLELIISAGISDEIFRSKRCRPIEKRLRKGLPLNPLNLDFSTRGMLRHADGSHRAYVSAKLGIRKVPVEKTTEYWDIK